MNKSGLNTVMEIDDTHPILYGWLRLFLSFGRDESVIDRAVYWRKQRPARRWEATIGAGVVDGNDSGINIREG